MAQRPTLTATTLINSIPPSDYLRNLEDRLALERIQTAQQMFATPTRLQVADTISGDTPTPPGDSESEPRQELTFPGLLNSMRRLSSERDALTSQRLYMTERVREEIQRIQNRELAQNLEELRTVYLHSTWDDANSLRRSAREETTPRGMGDTQRREPTFHWHNMNTPAISGAGPTINGRRISSVIADDPHPAPRSTVFSDAVNGIPATLSVASRPAFDHPLDSPTTLNANNESERPPMVSALVQSILDEIDREAPEWLAEGIPMPGYTVECHNALSDIWNGEQLAYGPGFIVPPVAKITERNAWQLREYLKPSAEGITLAPLISNPTPQHCAILVERGDTLLVSFFRNTRDAAKARRTEMAIGAYLTEYAGYPASEAHRKTESLQNDHGPIHWTITETADEVQDAYVNGPSNSCMTYANTQERWEVPEDFHPVRAYSGVSDFRLFLLKRSGKTIARCVVEPKRMAHGRLYGREDLCRRALREAGFVRDFYDGDYNTGGAIGGLVFTPPDWDRANRIAHMKVVLPYFDGRCSRGVIDPYQDIERNITEHGQIRILVSAGAPAKINGWELPRYDIEEHIAIKRNMTLGRCDMCGKIHATDGVSFLKSAFTHTKYPHVNTLVLCQSCRPHKDDCVTDAHSGHLLPRYAAIRLGSIETYVSCHAYINRHVHDRPIIIGNAAYTLSDLLWLDNQWVPKGEALYDPIENEYHAPPKDGIKIHISGPEREQRIAHIGPDLRQELRTYLQEIYGVGYTRIEVVFNSVD